MIAAAVAASMEKALAKSFQLEQDTSKPIPKRAHYGAESEDSDSSRERSHPPKHHWKGEAMGPRKSKGKAPAKRRQDTSRSSQKPTQASSMEEDAGPSHALAVVDEWQTAASDQEESDWDSAAKTDPYLIGEQTLGEPQDSVATTMDTPQEGSEIFLDNFGL
ncbi:Hypothetical predicted protein [Pelobates cultripes]|uniref:Uncharacterized protein n=1 Tax=Pelobates cultripes TaxID=61616 RepID=A0AAD1R9G0_PELCU|nr:Hypothetical predicted protein [Pelobates cultripes]